MYLSGSTRLNVGLGNSFRPPLQTEFVGRLSVLLTGHVELQVLIAELRSQERFKHCYSHWRTGEASGLRSCKRNNLNQLFSKTAFSIYGWEGCTGSHVLCCCTPTYATQPQKCEKSSLILISLGFIWHMPSLLKTLATYFWEKIELLQHTWFQHYNKAR